MRRVYICHPYSADPVEHTQRIQAICRRVVAMGHNPIAPQLWLPQFIDEETDRDNAMTLCLDIVGICSEMWIFHPGQEKPGILSSGQEMEVEEATLLIPTRHVYERPDGGWEFIYG